MKRIEVEATYKEFWNVEDEVYKAMLDQASNDYEEMNFEELCLAKIYKMADEGIEPSPGYGDDIIRREFKGVKDKEGG